MSIGFLGTNENGTKNKEYCEYCFKKGKFTEPDITMNDMIKKSANHITSSLRIPRDKAEETAKASIIKLKRWKQVAKE